MIELIIATYEQLIGILLVGNELLKWWTTQHAGTLHFDDNHNATSNNTHKRRTVYFYN